jgi:uncharacterized membrane protein YqiK
VVEDQNGGGHHCVPVVEVAVPAWMVPVVLVVAAVVGVVVILVPSVL